MVASVLPRQGHGTVGRGRGMEGEEGEGREVVTRGKREGRGRGKVERGSDKREERE